MTKPSPEALHLLLRLLEAPTFEVTRATVDYHGSRGQELLETRLLHPAGYDDRIVDEDDGELHAVERVSGRGLGYYSPTQGWAAVEQEKLRCYRPDIGHLFKVLFSDRISLPRQGPQALNDNELLWDMGTAYVGSKNSSVWFARRMSDERAAEELTESHRARPPGDTRIILTSTERKKLRRSGLPRAAIFSIDDAISAMDPIRIDMAVLKALLSGHPVEQITSAVFLSADNSTLWINGETVLVVSGEKQQQLLRLLIDTHEKGEPIKAAAMTARAGLAGHSFDKAFGKHWQTLRRHMKTKGGYWSFVV